MTKILSEKPSRPSPDNMPKRHDQQNILRNNVGNIATSEQEDVQRGFERTALTR